MIGVVLPVLRRVGAMAGLAVALLALGALAAEALGVADSGSKAAPTAGGGRSASSPGASVEPTERATARREERRRAAPAEELRRSSRRSSRAGAEPTDEAPGIVWRRSRALGSPSAGRLVRGVQLPPEGRNYFSWDPVLRRAPNRHWRRWGTDRLVRTLLDVTRRYRRANPGAPRVAIGDLSRHHGGDFGRRYGPIGHASHQNGLDADVYFPRRDGAERGVRLAAEVDRRLAQELVDRFVAAGAQFVFVGPGVGLRGPPRVVQAIPGHDNHLHVRLPPP